MIGLLLSSLLLLLSSLLLSSSSSSLLFFFSLLSSLSSSSLLFFFLSLSPHLAAVSRDARRGERGQQPGRAPLPAGPQRPAPARRRQRRQPSVKRASGNARNRASGAGKRRARVGCQARVAQLPRQPLQPRQHLERRV